jgi:calcineurin-like phosphoesterase family protein
MAETLVDNWNSAVRPSDVVYHLGDFAYGFGFLSRRNLKKIFGGLHGHKILIVGNHDLEETLGLPWVDIAKAALITVEEQSIHLSHQVPSLRLHKGGVWYLHGHTHGRQCVGLDVGVDCWDYHPVSFEAISRIVHADSALQKM